LLSGRYRIDATTQILNSTRFYASSPIERSRAARSCQNCHRLPLRFALLRHLLVSLLISREVAVQQSASVQVRINGIPINQVRLRGLQSSPQLVIVDPVIGAFEIDDRDNRFHVEVLDLNLSKDVRATLPNGGWKHTSVLALIAMLRDATEGSGTEAGDRSSWVHGSDIAELEGLRPAPEPSVLRARRGFRNAARILYAARIPYMIVGEYESPEAVDFCSRTVLVIVDYAPRAHERLCANGFKAHPANVNSVISADYNCEIHLVPSKKPKRKRNNPNGSVDRD
jgi:hypothetical protein